VDMLRHHDVANHLEFIFLTHFFKDFQEEVSPRSGAEEGLPLVTATGDEMEIPTSIEPAQSFGHGRNFILPFECEGAGVCKPTLCGRKQPGMGTDIWAAKDGARIIKGRPFPSSLGVLRTNDERKEHPHEQD